MIGNMIKMGLAMALALFLLAGCGAAKEPAETETTQPPVETAAPTETTAVPETTVAPEPTETEYDIVIQAYAPWNGYALHGAKLYDNADLAGEPVQVIHINVKMQVLSDLGNCYLVSIDDATGYVGKEYVSDHFVVYGGSGVITGGGSGEITESTESAENPGSSPEDEWSPPVL